MFVRPSPRALYLVAGLMLTTAAVVQAPRVAQAAQAAIPAKIVNFAFAPPTLTVHAGSAVTWTNADDEPHTVIADDGAFKSHALDTGDAFAQVFAKPGVYAYHCSLHPYMVGKIVVQR